MGFFSRLFNIGKSQVNTILDKMEDPAKLIDVQIENARKSVNDYQKQVASIMADHRLMAKKLQDAEREKEQWLRAAEKWAAQDEAKALDCVAKAEALDKEVLEYRKLVNEQAKIEEEMKANLEAVRQKLKEAEAARVQVKAAAKRAEAKEKTAKILSNKSFDDSSFSALERLKTKAIEMEANADATLELNNTGRLSMNEEKDLLEGPKDSSLNVNDRIAALKGGPAAGSSLESRIAALTAPKEVTPAEPEEGKKPEDDTK